MAAMLATIFDLTTFHMESFSMLFWGLMEMHCCKKKLCCNLFRVDSSESSCILDYVGGYVLFELLWSNR